jgi:hypothetical protein
MHTAFARPRSILGATRPSPARIAYLAALGPLEPSGADIVRSPPHAWALLADIACMAGQVERAGELIGLAYLAYDMLGPDACDSPIDFEDEEGPSDISVNRSSVFG